MTSALYLVAALLVLLGLVGIVVPVLPGGLLVFAGIVVLAWADGFARIGWAPLLACGGLVVLMGAAQWAAVALGARHQGGSRWGVLGAVAGLLVGLPIGLPGLLLGPLVGAFLAEYLRDRDFRRAARVGGGTFLGLVAGTVVQYALAATMLGIAAAAWAWD